MARQLKLFDAHSLCIQAQRNKPAAEIPVAEIGIANERAIDDANAWQARKIGEIHNKELLLSANGFLMVIFEYEG